MIAPSAIFAMFASALTANTANGLVLVGAHVTKIVTPVALNAFWWKPWAAGAIIIAAVAIVVTAVAVMYNKKKKGKGKTKIPNKLKSGNKVKTPSYDGDEFNKNKDGSYTIKKLVGILKSQKTDIMEESIGMPLLKTVI